MDKIFNYHPYVEVDFDNMTAGPKHSSQSTNPSNGEGVTRFTGRPITGNDILRDLDRNHDLR
jgi:hypothetical protein